MRIFEDKNLKINLAALVDSRMLLCANSGGGKSYAIRKLLEEAGDGVMSIILDVEGEFKTLREKYDFLLIGQSGDVPINIKAAHLLPAKLMELNVSTIIDISDFKMHDRILYVKRFLEAMMELPRKFWRPCLVIVDEAHMYCGQQEKQDSTHAVIDLMTRGRKRGFCGILATQRIAKLHKDAAAEANNYMVGRTGLDVDMKRAAEILGFASKADMLSLRDLEAGEFFVFGPAMTRAVTKAKVAAVSTTHPKVGMDIKGKITPPTAKIKAILSKLNDLPKEAEQKAKTIEELQKQVRDLQREAKKQPAAKVDEKQIEQVEKRGYDKANKEYYQQIYNLNKQAKILNGKLEKIAILAGEKISTVSVSPGLVMPRKQVHESSFLASPKPVNLYEKKTDIDGDTKLGICERKILSLLYNNPHREFTNVLVAIFTLYSHKSGSFKNSFSRLSSLGLIVRLGGKSVRFNESSSSQAAELLGDDINLYENYTAANWVKILPLCDGKIFSFLLDNHLSDFSMEEIGEATGYSPDSGSFKNAISHLNALGLIVKHSGRIKLNSEILEL